MTVYVIIQEWFNPSDGKDSIIVGVFDTLEKAKRKLEEVYREDVQWLKEECEFEEFEEDYIDDFQSFVQGNEDYWSFNEIQEHKLQ